MATNEDILVIVTKTDERMKAVESRLTEVEQHLARLNGSVKENCEELAVLKDWRKSQGDPAVKQVIDNRIEIAKIVMQATTLLAVLGMVLKLLGIL